MDLPKTCAHACEGPTYRAEIRRLKSTMVREAAELARLLQHEDMTEKLDRSIYAIIQRLKSVGLDGA